MRAREVPACVHAGTFFLLLRTSSRGREDCNSDKEAVKLADPNYDQPGREKKNPGASAKSKIQLATEVMKLLTETAKFVLSVLHGGS